MGRLSRMGADTAPTVIDPLNGVSIEKVHEITENMAMNIANGNLHIQSNLQKLPVQIRRATTQNQIEALKWLVATFPKQAAALIKP